LLNTMSWHSMIRLTVS